MRAGPEMAVSWLTETTLDEVKDSLSPKSTKIVANADIPEVLEFRDIVHNINKDYYAKSVAVLVKSMEETTGAFLVPNYLLILY